MPERLLPGPGRESSWPKSGHVASQTFSHNIHDSAAQVILFSSSDVRKAICSLAKEVMCSASTGIHCQWPRNSHTFCHDSAQVLLVQKNHLMRLFYCQQRDLRPSNGEEPDSRQTSIQLKMNKEDEVFSCQSWSPRLPSEATRGTQTSFITSRKRSGKETPNQVRPRIYAQQL